MQLKKYGVVIESLTESDLEQVRRWRNAEHVRTHMQHQQIITAEQQQSWFAALDKNINFYFVISANSKRGGVVNLKDVDVNAASAEAGIFIGEPELLNTAAPIAATLLIMEFAFDTLKLNSLKAKIGNDNANAIRFNKSLGYVKGQDEGSNGFHYYTVSAQQFEAATRHMRETLAKIQTT